MRKRFLSLLLLVAVIMTTVINQPILVNAQITIVEKKKFDTNYYHTAAIKENGDLYVWGKNNAGQVGDGTQTNRTKPVYIMSNVKSVSVGSMYTLALKTDGTLWAWGLNSNGEIGDRVTIGYCTTKPFKLMDNVIDMSAGEDFSFIVTNDNKLYALGNNCYGQLGDNTTTDRKTPTKILDDVMFVSAGWHSAAIKKDGTMWVWGGARYSYPDSLVPVKKLDDVKYVSADWSNILAIKNDNTLWGWGLNDKGELCAGDDDYTTKPRKIMNDVKDVSTSIEHTFLVNTAGELFVCGTSSYGQLGLGVSSSSTTLTPTKIMDDVSSVDVGFNTSFVCTKDGKLYACGTNTNGVLGDGSTTTRKSLVYIMDGLKKETPPIVIEDMIELFRDYPQCLNNETFNQIFYLCSDTVDEALNNIGVDDALAGTGGARTIWAAYRHMCLNGFEMTWTTILEKLHEALGYEGLSNYDKEIDRTTLEFMSSFCSKESAALASITQDIGNNIKKYVGDNYNLLYDSDIQQLAEDLSAASNGRYSISESKKIVQGFNANWDTISSAFNDVGTAVDFLDVLLATYMIDAVNNEVIDLFLDKVPSDTDLYDGLVRMKARQGSGSATYFLETYLSKVALSAILSKSPDFVASIVGYITQNANLSGATFALANGIISVATLAIDALPGSVEVDDIMNTMLYLNNAHTFNRTLMRDQTKFMNYYINGNPLSDEQYTKEIDDYKIIYSAVIESMRMSLENAKKLTDNNARKTRIDTCISLLDRWDFDFYHNACVSNVQNDYSDAFTYTENNGTITITGTSNIALASVELFSTENVTVDEILIIPSEINGMPVVSIAENAFSNNSSLDAVVISENVETIGANSFNGCSSLSTVIMGDSVESISNNAFKDCSSLSTIRLSNSTKTIGESAFANCASLNEITLPENVEEVKDSAFSGNASLNNFKVLGNDLQISDTAFENSSSVTIYALENSSAATFAQNQNIAYTAIAPTVTKIEIVKQPNKTIFNIGEKIDASGMELEITYSDNTVKTVSDGWILGCDISSGGEKTVYVYYDDEVTTYSVNIKYNKLLIEDISTSISSNTINCNLELSPFENDNKDKDIDIYSAIYDTDGSLIAVNLTEKTLSNINNTIANTTVTTEKLLENYVFAIFVWNDELEPYLDAQKYTVKSTNSGFELIKIN